jgi:phosphoadenosine phosphosulfate reductase
MRQLYLDKTDKIQEAIAFIREHEPPEGYFLGFSGGKDSVVLYNLVVKSGVKFQAYYSATGIDPPEVIQFIKRNYKDVVFLRPKIPFMVEIQTRILPIRQIRWCCDSLKKDPSKNILLKHRLMGVRAEESFLRRNRGQINTFPKNINYHPIFNWLEWEIWDYIESNNLPYCRLYDEGFDRIGCVICPFINSIPWKLKQHKERWPKMYAAFERAVLTSEKFKDTPWVLDNWYKNRKLNEH